MTKQSKQYFIERHKVGDQAILVQIDFGQGNITSLLNEFKELAISAKVEIIDEIIGKRMVPTAKYFVGEGKAQQIAEAVRKLEANVVLINHELTAAQGRNLEKLFDCRVLDRTALILDIFAQRAQSAEGKLQVELAQLQHLRTRLIRGWTHLERQKGGIGLRGPGETQLETDRRLIDGKIRSLEKKLEKLSNQRLQRRKGRKRATVPTVSLVGYTNAGKSTLFNALTHAQVYAANQLFATLDPTLRQIQLPPVGEVIIADTVGFIRDLPHDLVAAFRATLEETCQADLLLHVVDASHPDYLNMMHNVINILEEIGAEEVPFIEVYNKIDKQENQKPFLELDSTGFPRRVWLSALTGEGLSLLKEAITKVLQDPILLCEIELDPGESKLRSKLFELGAVEEEKILENGAQVLKLKIRRIDCHRLLRGRRISI